MTKRLLFLLSLAAPCLPCGKAVAQAQFNLAMPTNGAGSTGPENAFDIVTDASGNVYMMGFVNNNTTSYTGNTDFDLSVGGTSNGTFNNAVQTGYVASYTKAGAFRWATTVSNSSGTGNSFNGQSGSLATDGSFVWVTGTVSGAASTTVRASNGSTLTAASQNTASNNEAFVAKLSCADGTAQWARTFGSPTAADMGTAVCVDPSGNAYVIGQYSTGFTTTDNVTFPAPNGGTLSDLYLAKFNSIGTMTARITGGSASMADMTAGGGICYVPGATPAIVAVGSSVGTAGTTITFGGFSFTANGQNDVILVKTDVNLSAFTFATSFGTPFADIFHSVAYDAATADVYVCGIYNQGGSSANNITFPGRPALTNNGAGDLMVARFDPVSNSFIWSAGAGGNNGDQAFSVTTDGRGGVLCAGSYASTTNWNFGSSVVPGVSGTGNDVMLFKYSVSGNPEWILTAGGTGLDDGFGVASYIEGGTKNVFLCGQFSTSITFNTTTLTGTNNGTANTDFYLARAVDNNIPLPLTLLDVTARNDGERNLVQWSTGSEKNLDAFDVERSADGTAFARIGGLKARGSGDYAVADNSPLAGRNLYRLKMMELDGSFTYSKVVEAYVSRQQAVVLSTSPNPVRNELQVRVQGASTGRVQLLDLSGRLLVAESLRGGSATIGTAGLAAGTYYLQFSDGTTSKTIKVSKL